ncbi:MULTISPECIES: hypothetical protein [Agrobacterium]|uniref:hypothetical protein n=1 Tax=Agrobacterium TaxID=357 RepID=UPI001573355D|nr:MULTISPECIES: hypothetical protein [Agrobacterium]NTJ44192.1 hypothetical protein [Agrobacterium larrymoorei]WCK22462.1 hypothetical protein G6M09_025425 [Agrobacterium tumefaciens]
MILDPKFLCGFALGGAQGVVFAPRAESVGIDLPRLKISILVQMLNEKNVTDKGDRPPDQAAKEQVFPVSKWDIKNFVAQSSVLVTNCISIPGNSIACEMTAKFGWIEDDTALEGVFEAKMTNDLQFR